MRLVGYGKLKSTFNIITSLELHKTILLMYVVSSILILVRNYKKVSVVLKISFRSGVLEI